MLRQNSLVCLLKFGFIYETILGRDFNLYEEISVHEQVNRLIEQATLYDNLCQCYIGW